jgi:RNA polymerase sigma-70 factor, ECF subfamily
MSSHTDEDYEILQNVAKGDSKAFESLYKKHKSALYGFCVYLTGETMRAQDIYQDTWIKISENAHTYQARNSFKSWSFQIARNLFLNQIKRDKWEEKVGDDELSLVADEAETEKDYYDKEKNQILAQIVSQLPENQRVAVVLFLVEDLNHSEIAVQMNLSVNNVKVLIHRAKQKLEVEIQRRLNGKK